jgi:hypothetical protein
MNMHHGLKLFLSILGIIRHCPAGDWNAGIKVNQVPYRVRMTLRNGADYTSTDTMAHQSDVLQFLSIFTFIK